MVRYNNSRIDHIYETWLKNQKDKKDNSPFNGVTITISGKCGEEGLLLAEKLCSLLKAEGHHNWHIYEKQLINDVSKELNVDEDFIHNIGMEAQFLDFSFFSSNDEPTSADAFKAIINKIFAVAHHGNVILIGRGSEIITKDLPNCLHYRLESNFEHRVQLLSSRLNLSHDEAEKFVKVNQEKRQEFVEKYFSCKLGEAYHYNAIYNTEKKSLDRIAHNICGAILEKIQNEKY